MFGGARRSACPMSKAKIDLMKFKLNPPQWLLATFVAAVRHFGVPLHIWSALRFFSMRCKLTQASFQNTFPHLFRTISEALVFVYEEQSILSGFSSLYS
jgi:hypothetical protein